MKLQINLSERISGALIALLIVLLCNIQTDAASPDKYSSSSVLSQGKWVRVEIKTPGLQTISASALRNFGFTDLSKVNVYGYGGQMIPEALRPDLPDDLPMVPVLRDSSGAITFYGTGIFSWEPDPSAAMLYTHTINPYAETSYYFLSDRDTDGAECWTLDLSDTDGLEKTNAFVEHLVHENDIIQCASSGRDYLGEDFRVVKNQTFSFDLPDICDAYANIRVRFGANTSGAQSSIFISANGEQLPSVSTDKIDAVRSGSDYYKVLTTTKPAEISGDRLEVGIQYNAGGVVSIARLDWIEVEYNRHIALKDSKLHFHVNPDSPMAYSISGASENTIVWDVTDPGNVKIVKGRYNADDKALSIAVRESGYREFFAFDPSAKATAINGRMKVSNQNIHSLPVPDMVIVSPEEYTSSAERIANLHRTSDGMTVHVLSPEKIYNEFSSGSADASAIRKMLKMWHDRANASDSATTQVKYCLIMSRPTYDNKIKNQDTRSAGYPRVPIWQSKDAYTESSSYCTDDFMGMLEDESSVRQMWQRTINVAVARYPVTSVAEAAIAVDKLEQYVNSMQFGTWRNNVMVIADDEDNAQHLDQAQRAIQLMQANGSGEHFAYERLYLDAFERKKTGKGNEYPDAKARMLKKWEKEGVALINYIGHANPKEWGHEKLLTWQDMNNMSNQTLPVVYAATCSFGQWDSESVSGAEVMLLNPAGGAIAVITPSRSVYITKNGDLTEGVATQAFRKNAEGKLQRLGDIITNAKNNIKKSDANANRYHFFGDPALRMPGARYRITIDSLAGMPIQSEISDSPSICARSKVKVSGHITDETGEPVDFNGQLQYTLFDAETSVETHGWGDNGKVSVYQDRPDKLATGCTSVTDGLWETTILMPSEIANNYSPALLMLYAYNQELGLEANGSTDRLFVYGYDDNCETDTEGPVIELFTINNENYKQGDIVHQNPVVIATFSDESGINISDAGLGHRMALTLDSKTSYDDINNFYTPDPQTPGAGSIAYPMQNLEPGEHELRLTVWDNANNSSSASLNFRVGLNMRPEIFDLSTVYHKDDDKFTFDISTDRALCRLDCTYECRGLDGELLWSDTRKTYSGKDSTTSYIWDLTDFNGRRIPRGIYIIRATVTSEDGLTSTHNKKIAVPAR